MQLTLVLELQQPHCPPDLPAGEDDEDLNVALPLTEWYGVEPTDPWSLEVAEEEELLPETQELVDCPPRAPDWALWTLKTLWQHGQVVLECRAPKPIDHLQEDHQTFLSSLEGENDEEEQVRAQHGP